MPDATNHVLWYRKLNGTIQELPLSGDITIGRAANCDLVLDDDAFAPQHIRINLKPDGVWVTVLSTSGTTRLDDQPLSPDSPQKFLPGQVITIDSYTFTLVRQQAPEIEEQGTVPLSSETSPEPEIPPWLRRIQQLGRVKLALIAVVAVIVIAAISFGGMMIASRNGLKPIAQITPTIPPTPPPSITKTVQTPTIEPTKPFVLTPIPSGSQIASLLTITPPGLGSIQFSPLTISSENINPADLLNFQLSLDQLLTLGTQITGKNIGFVYRYAGITKDNQVLTTELSYINAEVNNETGGVTYPQWGDQIPVQFDWKPTVYYMSDGNKSEMALVRPIDYSTFVKDATYAVKGIYTFSNDGTKTLANIYFDKDGKVSKIIGYSKNSEGKLSAPSEILPNRGDQFTILLQRFEITEKLESAAAQIVAPGISTLASNYLGENASKIPVTIGKGNFVDYEGGTLTFGDQSFTWKSDNTYTGQYVVGVIVEDLDGNYIAAYIPVLVTR